MSIQYSKIHEDCVHQAAASASVYKKASYPQYQPILRSPKLFQFVKKKYIDQKVSQKENVLAARTRSNNFLVGMKEMEH